MFESLELPSGCINTPQNVCQNEYLLWALVLCYRVLTFGFDHCNSSYVT